MGGDDAPRIVVEGAIRARWKYPHVSFLIFGDEKKIAPLLKGNEGFSLRHTPDFVASDEKPSLALRSGRNSSMRLAIDAVAAGEAAAVVSAGNTGALMAMAKFVLKVLPGITRPAIVAHMPTRVPGQGVVMLDLGANVECDARNLLEFAVLGGVFSRAVLKVEMPRIGLLNIGSEAVKGHDVVRQAADLLAQAAHLPGRNIGFVEGDDIAAGTVDVVVTDGFTGNIALKTMEGTAKLVAGLIKRTFTSSWLARLGAVLCLPGFVMALPALLALKKRIDPRCYNGAALIGLRGLCIKSHGGTDGTGFANAIGVAVEMAEAGFNARVAEEMKYLAPLAAAPVDAA